jgi:hypothetical protein
MGNVATNWEQFKFYINNILIECLEEISNQTGKELQKYVQSEWYEAHSSIDYDRTMQFLNSIINTKVESKGGGFIVSVAFDEKSIIPNFLGSGMWNEHMGFSGAPFVGGLIETIEEGNLSPYSPPYARTGIHMLEKTAYWLTINLPKIAKQVFVSHGMNVTIT